MRDCDDCIAGKHGPNAHREGLPSLDTGQHSGPGGIDAPAAALFVGGRRIDGVTGVDLVLAPDLADNGVCSRHPRASLADGAACTACFLDPLVNRDLLGHTALHGEGAGEFGPTLQPGDTPGTTTVEITADLSRWHKALAGQRQRPPRHADKARRSRYAAAIRDHLKAFTLPPLTPGGPPALGETEYDIADVVLAERDTDLTQACAERDAARERLQLARDALLRDGYFQEHEVGDDIAPRIVEWLSHHQEHLDQVRAERDAALRLADVWADAPDPLVRHSAADLRTAIRGARPAATEATEARLLDCGLCYEENGEEVHPHPECRKGDRGPRSLRRALARALRRGERGDAALHWVSAERDRLQRAVDGLRRLNELTADASARVHAREHARDNLALLNGILGEPPAVPATSKASSAREELLNLMATWGLTTGRGSREHADRILNRRDQETTQALSTSFAGEVAELVERLGEQHHPAMNDTPTGRRARRSVFADLARDWGRHNRRQFDPRGPEHDRQDWTGILLEAVYDLLAEELPTECRRHLVILAAFCQAWAADIDRGTTQRAELVAAALDNDGPLTKLGQSGS